MPDSSSLVLRALDPSRSVVVEACAGSGKTWLLASRVVRLLLGGVAPGEILAITFTRKAAREIEERVVDWLHLLATGSETQVAAFLAERGVTADPATVRAARGLYERVLAKLKADPSVLSSDGNANVKTIRALMAQEIAAYQSNTQVDLLQSTLVGLAHDADVVLDLHCDEKAVMHTYTLPQLWPQLEPLARYLRSECQILSENSGSNAFDEFLSTIWLRLSREFPQANIPLACFSTTIELRGEGDLQHEWAQTDAQAIVQYLAHIGAIKLDEQAIQAMPDLIREPNPLSGLSYVLAPLAGIAVYRVHPGDTVTQGQVVADIIDPIHQICTPVTTPTDGFVYAVHHANFAQQGTTLVSVSGAKDLGLGDALGP